MESTDLDVLKAFYERVSQAQRDDAKEDTIKKEILSKIEKSVFKKMEHVVTCEEDPDDVIDHGGIM